MGSLYNIWSDRLKNHDQPLSPVAVGGVFGAVGGSLAGVVGVARGHPRPFIRAVAGGISYFLWGTTLWACRTQFLSLLQSNQKTSQEQAARSETGSRSSSTPTIGRRSRILATTAAGAVAGAGAGTFATVVGKQRGALFPAIAIWTILAFSGQEAWESYNARPMARTTPASSGMADHEKDAPAVDRERRNEGGLLDRIAGSRWSPFTALSDHEYKAIMEEKLLGIDAEIAMIDEEIEELRRSEAEKGA